MQDNSAPPKPRIRPQTEPLRGRRRARPAATIAVVIVIAAIVAAWLLLKPQANPAPAGQAGPRSDSSSKDGGGRRGADTSGRPIPIVAAPAVKGSIDVYLSGLGTITPRNVVTVRARVDGQLMKIAFQEGQQVRAGELLAEIDPRPYQVQLTQALGQMAKDEALLRNAQVDAERYKTLLAQDSISKQQVDTQESLVRQYQGAIKSDQGAIDAAKLQVTYARITAPISGRIGLRQVDVGNIVHASDSNGLAVIAQLQPISAIFALPQDDLPRIMKRLQEGNAPLVELWDRDQKVKIATGKLLTVDNQIDTSTGTVKLKAEFSNQNNALFPNQFVNVRMLVDTLQDATLIPTAAIQRGSPGTFVYVVKDDNSVTVRPVTLGPAQGNNTMAESGVAPGERVVIDGADKLREGAKVEPITREAQTAPPPGTRSRSGSGGKAADAAKGAAPTTQGERTR